MHEQIARRKGEAARETLTVRDEHECRLVMA